MIISILLGSNILSSNNQQDDKPEFKLLPLPHSCSHTLDVKQFNSLLMQLLPLFDGLDGWVMLLCIYCEAELLFDDLL